MEYLSALTILFNVKMCYPLQVFLSVMGVALAAPQHFLPHESPDVAAARAQFIQEYNRLAKLAAEAPDIHIYWELISIVRERRERERDGVGREIRIILCSDTLSK